MFFLFSYPPLTTQIALFLRKKPSLLETGTFFKWGKITTWQVHVVQAISAKYERSTKMHGAF